MICYKVTGHHRRPYLLVLTSTFPRWAGDREPPFVFELSQRLRRRFRVIVLAPHTQGSADLARMAGLLVVRYRYAPVRWESLAYHGGILANLRANRWNYLLVPGFVLAQFWVARRLLRRRKIAFIHAHWLIPQGLVALLCRLGAHRPPVVLCTSHGGDLFALRSGMLAVLKGWVLRRCDAITVVSHAMRDYALTIGGRSDRIHVISMGVDTRQQFTPQPDRVREPAEILFVGRLVPKKGLIHLLRALPGVLARHPDAVLTVAGDGPERSTLQALATRAGFTHQVRFLGEIPNADLVALYRRVAVFVAPSVITVEGDQEGLGLVIAEALACECPVVASRLPAILDLVEDGVTGLLAQPGDSADLAAKINRLLDEPEWGACLGRAGREWVLSRFDWARIAARYLTLLESLRPDDG